MSEPELLLDGRVRLHCGDSRDVLRGIASNSIDSCVCDPPYALVSIVKRFGKPGAAPSNGNAAYARASAGFMGKAWDTGEVAFAADFWAEVLRVLKPGGHVFAFSGTRTYHRMAVAIEDAGFEIRDQLAWMYGTGFPKSHDVSKAIDKAAGAEREIVGFDPVAAARTVKIGTASYGDFHGQSGDITAPATAPAKQWSGWGTALKPAWEPICLARKPLVGTVAENVIRHGTGAINVDGCRIALAEGDDPRLGGEGSWKTSQEQLGNTVSLPRGTVQSSPLGRFPANILHDGSDEVLSAFPDTASGSGAVKGASAAGYQGNAFGAESRPAGTPMISHGDAGSAARFFYSAKADADDRLGSKHPTVKPVDLMQWLVRLVTPPGGLTLDPFAGTGTTGEAAWREGCSAVLVEREADYQADIRRRMTLAVAGSNERRREGVRARAAADGKSPDFGPMFTAPEAAE